MGEHRVILVPENGDIAIAPEPYMTTRDGSGKYTLAIASCSNDNRSVIVSGEVMWKSKHGFLP